jgi:predicted transcriptional regulator
MYRSPNEEKQVCGVELSELAHKIARQRKISFGEALFAARREIAMGNGIDTVQQDTGSPLRTQPTSTTPDVAKVRSAVYSGLNETPWKVSEASDRVDAGSVFLGVLEVGSRLSGLGLGPQIISSLKAELSTFLNNAFNQSTAYKPSDVIPQAADHMAAIYKQALANKLDTQVWAEDGVARPVAGMALRDRAEELSRRRNISFGEALKLARNEINFSSNASMTSVQVGDAVRADVENAISSAFDGNEAIIFESQDALNVMEAVKAAIARLDIGSLGSEAVKAAETTLNAYVGGKLVYGQPGSIAGKVIAAMQKAYDAALSSAK